MKKGLKKILLMIENMEYDLKYMILEEYFNGTLRTESVKEKCFKYIKDSCNSLPISVKNIVCNVVYRSYYRWLETALSLNETNFEEAIIKLISTDYVCVYDINGENVSLRKQVENIITYDKTKDREEVLRQHFLERKLRDSYKKYLICLKFGEKSEIIEKLAYKYYNYIRNRSSEYETYCKENNLRRSDWRCKILMAQKFKDSE